MRRSAAWKGKEYEVRLKPTRWRWLSQVIFFSLFAFLLLRTEFRGSLHAGGSEIRIPYPVSLFFQFDPLVALSNALSSHALYRGLFWSLIVLIPTMLIGRFFCGWICPLGSIHHFFSSLKSERKRGKQLLESNRYKRWQTTKYYILAATSDGGPSRHGRGRLARSVLLSRAFPRPLNFAGYKLRTAGSVGST